MPTWERQVLTLAEQGMGEEGPVPAAGAPLGAAHAPAYRACERITAENSRSFHLASRFLPAPKRRAIRALYAFCRITDDIVDGLPADAEARLDRWQGQTLSAAGGTTQPVALAWRDAQRRFLVPQRYAQQLMEGVRRDLHPEPHQSFESLAQYCYRVASTVGLMSMHIIGFSSRRAVRYAVKLGVALQLTNILRDVGEDLRSGRLYLPLDELAAFDIHADQLYVGRVDQRWRRFMHFQVSRARQLFQEARPGIRLLHREGRFAVAVAADLYAGILREIEANAYDVFTRRAHLGTAKKLVRLPGIWLRTRYPGKRAALPSGSP